MILQQRINASSYTDKLRESAAKAQEAEVKVQQLDKLRAIHDDYQKLSNELIPAAEKNLDALRQEKARLTDAHEDVKLNRSFSLSFVLSCYDKLKSSFWRDIVNLILLFTQFRCNTMSNVSVYQLVGSIMPHPTN